MKNDESKIGKCDYTPHKPPTNEELTTPVKATWKSDDFFTLKLGMLAIMVMLLINQRQSERRHEELVRILLSNQNTNEVNDLRYTP